MIQGTNTPTLVIDSTGAWRSGRDYFFCKDTAKWMRDFFRDKSVADFGCGADALYVQYLRDKGIEAYGYDAHEDTGKIPFCRTLNMVTDIPPPKRDWAMCLEVMEHIPAEFEGDALSTLDACNREGIVMSWAWRGQGGTGHVNEKNTDEVIATLMNLGYRYDVEASTIAKQKCPRYRTMGGMRVFRRCQR